MPNSDQDARSDVPFEPDSQPASPTSLHQPSDPQDSAPSAPAANDADPLAPRARPVRRRKPADLAATDGASLFDPSDAPAPGDTEEGAPARPRAAPRRRTPRIAAAPDTQAEPAADAAPPDATPPGDAEAAPAQPAAESVTAPITAPQVAPPEPPAPEPAPQPADPGPPRPLVITAADAALAVVNPHPMRANDRPDGYLYHLSSPAEARTLMQSGLPCNVDDPIILTERGGVPYWLGVLSEDYDDILDGPAAVTVLRIRRRAVQNAIEADADSSRAAQAPCYLLTGISGLPPAPPAPPPPLLRARPPVPAVDPAEPGTAVEMGGTVKWYNPRKGFGFITPGSGGKDVFVHASTLERAGLPQLTDGQSVRMHVIQGAKGPEAASLSLA